MTKIDLYTTTYVYHITTHNFLFRVEVCVGKNSTIIESIRCKDDQDEWRDTKYSVKKEILEEVERLVFDWLKKLTSTWVTSVS